MRTRATRRGGTLVEILIVVLLMVGFAVFLVPRYLTAGKATGNKELAPKQRAQQAVGVSYVQQINQAIAMYRMDHDEQYPSSLQDLKRYGVTDEMLIDPVSKQPLSYDPQTGRVVGTSTPDSVDRAAQLLGSPGR